jgi:general secretion pathway protein N
VLLLSGGPGSRDASALPGRLRWDIGLSQAFAAQLRLQHPCCQDAPAVVGLHAGIGTWGLTLPAQPAGLGVWPAAWLAGLGTPFNTLQMSGTIRVGTSGASVEWAQGRLRMRGSVQFEFADVSSRIVAIDTLGSYRLVLAGGAGGRWSTGRLLDFGYRRHGDLWVSVAQAMGDGIGRFGDASSGPLPGL